MNNDKLPKTCNQQKIQSGRTELNYENKGSNLCYRYGKKYFPGHKCKLKTMIVVEKCEEEEIEGETSQVEDQ